MLQHIDIFDYVTREKPTSSSNLKNIVKNLKSCILNVLPVTNDLLFYQKYSRLYKLITNYQEFVFWGLQGIEYI